jgi:rhodanese-related sulfurtransferase
MEIDCRSVKFKLDAGDEFLLLDCRERDEHQLVNISAARLLPMSELQARVGELDPYKHTPVIVHCHHGGRSLKVAHWLKQQGFDDVKSMAGGIDEWACVIDPSLPRY